MVGRSSAGRFAYIGSYTSSGGAGITVAAVDEDTGALRAAGGSDAEADPSFLALSPDRGTLYCVSETPRGAVGAFRAGHPGQLERLGRGPVAGDRPTHLSLTPGGRAVLTANYGSGSVSVLPLGDDGRPGPVAGVLHHHGTGPVPDRQDGPHAHQVVTDPSGRWALAVDLGTDGVHVYQLGATGVSLRPHDVLVTAPGRGPRHLVFHPGGRMLYLVNELTPTVTACAWDPVAGRLRLVADVPLVPEGAAGEHFPSNAVVSPDGRFLHVADRGGNTLTTFAVTPAGELLEPLAVVDCGGDWPRHLAADPSGRRLYVANERSGEVAWFAVDPETGLPEQRGALRVAAPTCVVFD